jgi:4-deoxy-L-threo-5-hexosulose-uronate ketol-isomerase
VERSPDGEHFEDEQRASHGMNRNTCAMAGTAGKMGTGELRSEFLVSGLFQPAQLNLRYWETDRTIVGGISPTDKFLDLGAPSTGDSGTFLGRREAGIVNLGGPGLIRADGVEHRLEHLDALYLGMGAKAAAFGSQSPANPARFWLLSYPAHTAYPARHIAFGSSRGERLGGRENANERMLHKMIHPGAFQTCQIVMGVTLLEPGSVWNTMPPHTHLRRSEVYLYFDVPADQMVLHVMGQPQDTRHLVVRNLDAVLSPPWSIHTGVGTASYGFVWGMGGENQEFADMDRLAIGELR